MSARSIRLYIPPQHDFDQDTELTLDGEAYHYLARVLRVNQNEMLRIFNEYAGEWHAHVASVGKTSMTLRMGVQLRVSEPLPPFVLGMPLIRPQWMECMLAMGTQCGITDFIPLHSDYSQKHILKEDRARRIVLENTEQSERLQVPRLHSAMTFKAFVEAYGDKLYAAVEPRYATDAVLEPQFASGIALMLGPEGGYSLQEIDFFKSQGVKTFSVKGIVARAETALPLTIGYLRGLVAAKI